MQSQFSAKNKRRYNDDDANTDSHQQIVPPRMHAQSRPSHKND